MKILNFNVPPVSFFGRPDFDLMIVGDAYLRPVLDAAKKQVERDREVSISYFFAAGGEQDCNAVIVCDDGPEPFVGRPWRRVRTKQEPSSVLIKRFVTAIKQCIDEVATNS
jgi:hypothetical protein